MEEYQDRSLRGRVFEKLREDILSGVYKDCDELREITIGEEMGVSRTPVREALRQLELEGLVRLFLIKELCNRYYAERRSGYLHDSFYIGRYVRQMGDRAYHSRTD